MTEKTWTFDPSDSARLRVQTGVTGKAARMGHRLTIAVTRWQAVVEWADDLPATVELTAEVDSIDVEGGEGGVTPLLGPEKALARSNALKTFDAKRFPLISFRSDDIDTTTDGFRLTGTLEIHGTSRQQSVDLRVDDDGQAWRLSSVTDVRQSDFGIKPYSQLMGAMKVVDDVTVSFTATRTKIN